MPPPFQRGACPNPRHRGVAGVDGWLCPPDPPRDCGDCGGLGTEDGLFMDGCWTGAGIVFAGGVDAGGCDWGDGAEGAGGVAGAADWETGGRYMDAIAL